MEKLSNGSYVLRGDYIKSKNIKQCNNCECFSPTKVKTCCWCGSKNLKTVNGSEEVKKELHRL